jgi:uncharacterized repeat protein (TIGR03803 family)
LFKYVNGVYTNLHTFIGERPVERAKPIISDDGFIYGVTNQSIYKIKTDGTGFQVLHPFEQATGINPFTGLVLYENNYLLGITQGGGLYNAGVLYSLTTQGGFFSVIKHFESNYLNNIDNPLLGIDGNVYGFTEKKIVNQLGIEQVNKILYRVNTQSTVTYDEILTIENFSSPISDLFQDTEGKLYAIAQYGGQANTTGYRPSYIFKIENVLAEPKFEIIHHF